MTAYRMTVSSDFPAVHTLQGPGRERIGLLSVCCNVLWTKVKMNTIDPATVFWKGW